jgi:hypothetical protein
MSAQMQQQSPANPPGWARPPDTNAIKTQEALETEEEKRQLTLQQKQHQNPPSTHNNDDNPAQPRGWAVGQRVALLLVQGPYAGRKGRVAAEQDEDGYLEVALEDAAPDEAPLFVQPEHLAKIEDRIGMAMSKKHFEAIAAGLRDLDIPEEHKQKVVNMLGGVFGEDNPNYNHQRFVDAVGGRPHNYQRYQSAADPAREVIARVFGSRANPVGARVLLRHIGRDENYIGWVADAAGDKMWVSWNDGTTHEEPMDRYQFME